MIDVASEISPWLQLVLLPVAYLAAGFLAAVCLAFLFAGFGAAYWLGVSTLNFLFPETNDFRFRWWRKRGRA